MRLLQLSDPHLLADPAGLCRGRASLNLLGHGVQQALTQLERQGDAPDLLLITGDLCQDESWLGYVQLRELLTDLDIPVALLPGNHDHTTLLAAALGRRAALAPALLTCNGVDLLLLDSHRPGALAGWLGPGQLTWLQQLLARRQRRPLVVAMHHPPVPIGDPGLDAIALRDAADLLTLLQPVTSLVAVLFGHVHQHWQGGLPGRPEVPLLGCPSTLCSFAAVQPCPLGRPEDPGGRLVVVSGDGSLRQQLLRWPAPAAVPTSVGPADFDPAGTAL